MFEKKEIDPKYPTDILCDFIYDKAKKTVTKLEGLANDNKVLKTEQSYYFQKKFEEISNENLRLKQSADILHGFVFP